jgi:hypothetical protein
MQSLAQKLTKGDTQDEFDFHLRILESFLILASSSPINDNFEDRPNPRFITLML